MRADESSLITVPYCSNECIRVNDPRATHTVDHILLNKIILISPVPGASDQCFIVWIKFDQ